MILFFKNKEEKELIKAINFILGYNTRKPELFKLALLHRSIKNEESNERLEFLGDAILGLIVAKYLFKLYPYKNEGFLTKIRSKIVNRESLNNIGRKIGLKRLINIKRFKSKSYDSIYGDALEAIIGACYLEKGFEFYEYRKEKTEPKEKTLEVRKKLNPIEWSGENLDNKKILIISEQGIGDNIQFFRYLFSLKENYKCEIVFYTDKILEHLFKNSPFQIITDLKDEKDIDYFQNLLSLPGIFYKKNKFLQSPINYINFDNKKSLFWKNKLEKFKKPVIALNWQGSKDFLFDDERSIDLINFKNILNINKYSFISLQKNFGSEQIDKYNFSNLIYDFSNEIDINGKAFEDTIHILININLLITSDTALAHLAGTMGIKTYLLLSYNPEWRWFIEIQKKCFYPEIKIIQQKEYGNWKGVFKQLEDLLA